MDKIKVKFENEKDKKSAEILEDWLNDNYEEHREFVEALIGVRLSIDALFGYKTKDVLWDRIMSAYIKKIIDLSLTKNNGNKR